MREKDYEYLDLAYQIELPKLINPPQLVTDRPECHNDAIKPPTKVFKKQAARRRPK